MDANQIFAIVDAALRRHAQPGNRLTIGLSGGLDSVVLLHLLKQLADTLQLNVAAHHVNHHLSVNAVAWQNFCSQLCASWQVPFAATHVQVLRDQRKGLEAAARVERYRAFNQVKTDFIVLGHHQDDQAETVLLQLFRGAGVRGLSGMAEVRRQVSGVRNQEEGALFPATSGSPAFLRPLLKVPRAVLREYAQRHGLRWIEDESNDDISYSRNFLRHKVLPQLASQFPAYRENIARAVGHYAEAQGLLDDLAHLDAQRAVSAGRLEVSVLASLSQPRAKNLLRFFIHQHGLPMPEQVRLEEMLRQLLTAKDDAAIRIVHEARELRRFRGKVYLLQPFAAETAEVLLDWRGQTEVALPEWGGCMQFEAARGAGVAANLLQAKAVKVRSRRGGERLRLRAGSRSRTLKNLLQESAMPPWERERLPLLVLDGRLVCVPGIGVDAAFQCPPEAAGVSVHWRPMMPPLP